MALCLARVLAGSGHKVTVADYMKNAMTFYSRWASAKLLYPSPYSAADQFLEALREAVLKYHIDVVIPVHEETFLISKHLDELRQTTSIASADYKAILTVHSKDITM